MLKSVMRIVGPKLGKQAMTVSRYSPELYLGAGIICGAASAILLARSHKKASWEMAEGFEELETASEYLNRPEMNPTPKERVEILTPPLKQIAIKSAKLYGPSIVLGIGSVCFLLAAHGVQKRRINGLVSTVLLLERSFATYRQRVVEEYGQEAEDRLYFGAEKRRITTLQVGPDGKKKKKKRDVNAIPENPHTIMYQRTFDRTNPTWEDDPDLNLLRLQVIEGHANDWLMLKGVVLLNEVYKNLGFQESTPGAVVGWALNGEGDGFVDLGITADINSQEGDDRWILNPNVDGLVYDLIG